MKLLHIGMKTLHMNRILLSTMAAFALCTVAAAQQIPTPAPAQKTSTLIMNVTAHLGTGKSIDNAAIGFENGKLTLVADATTIRLDMSRWQRVIDGTGQHAYPGFIAPNSTLGLQEVEQIRATLDATEVGTYKPSVRALIAFNTDSEIIPTVRSNGVLMEQVTPRGGVISGTSSVVQLDAWNWEDACLLADDGLHLNWPTVVHRNFETGKSNVVRSKTYDQQLREIESFFNEARAYCNDPAEPLTEVRFEALCAVYSGKRTLYVHANDLRQIQEAVAFKKKMSIPRMVLVEGYDAWLAADLLKENNVPVMLRRMHSLPVYNEDDVLLPFKLPRLLHDAGVLFCLQNSGDQEHHGVRNLPFYAGTAAAYGLPYEEAVKSITLNTARILGIDQFCGSLETGKDATLFISKGDALDMLGNEVVHAFIQGREIDLDNKQKELYRKYRKKYISDNQ